MRIDAKFVSYQTGLWLLAGALVLGFIPTPPNWKTPALDMTFGFCFIALMVWGLGGLLLFHGPRHTHRHA